MYLDLSQWLYCHRCFPCFNGVSFSFQIRGDLLSPQHQHTLEQRHEKGGKYRMRRNLHCCMSYADELRGPLQSSSPSQCHVQERTLAFLCARICLFFNRARTGVNSDYFYVIFLYHLYFLFILICLLLYYHIIHYFIMIPLFIIIFSSFLLFS